MNHQKQKPFPYLLLFILCLGAGLRFWNYGELPFTHDELSMMARLQFHSFADLIEKGVKPDGHPAGVQVFMWFWIQLFGQTEAAVKFPFILMGIGSIYMGYLVGKRWFSESTGILTAVFLACLQYSITLGSQIARPYASGLLLALALVWTWTKLIFPEENKTPKITDFVAFSVLGVLNCYNHHFSLLFTGIIVASGFLYWQHISLKAYLLAVIGIGILYLPHLSIFLYQLSVGGIGWLSKPDGYFFWYYFTYVFHFSSPLLLWVIGVTIAGIFLKYNKKISFNKTVFGKRALLFTWFSLPLLLGFAYSVCVSPILQASMLLFSFPFLLIFLFSFYEWKNWTLWAISGISIALCTYTLIIDRQQFNVMYHQPFKQYHAFGAEIKNQKKETVKIILNVNPVYQRYYDTISCNPVLPFQPLADVAKDIKTWKLYLAGLTESDLVLGGAPREYLLSATEIFPHLLHKEEGFTYEEYHLSKSPSSSVLSPQNDGSIEKNENEISLSIPDSVPYHVWIEVSAVVKTAEIQGDENLVFEVWKAGKKIGERSTALNTALEKNTGKQTVWAAERLRHLLSPYESRKGCVVKAFLKSGNSAVIPIKLKINITEGNPLIYGLLYKIE